MALCLLLLLLLLGLILAYVSIVSKIDLHNENRVIMYADSCGNEAMIKSNKINMFGKHFSSMYSGSMFGCGAINFAVMGYVIANFRADRDHGAVVELNAKLLAAILGEPLKKVDDAIKFLCSPDKQSRNKEEDGRRLVKISEFEYKVVSGAKYRAIRDEETRREQNREAQAKFRMKLPQRKIKYVTQGDLKITPEEAGRRAENPFNDEME